MLKLQTEGGTLVYSGAEYQKITCALNIKAFKDFLVKTQVCISVSDD